MAYPLVVQNFDDLVYENPTALKTYVCDEIVDRFKKDERKKQGVTTAGMLDTEIKKSIDLPIGTLEEWKDIDTILFESVAENIQLYGNKVHNGLGNVKPFPLWTNRVKDYGYNVKGYEPGDYFHWHVDRQAENSWVRTVAFIWYLNDVKEGGETEFIYGRSIKPQKGKLLMFPACWTYPHRGLSPKNGNKYIITTFVYTEESDNVY